MPKFNVAKSVVIEAPKEKVHDVVRDFQKWRPWSPWLIAEPDCQVNYAADGMSYNWEGKVVGSGEMAISGEDAPRSIDYDLNFLKPWKSYAKVRFQFDDTGSSTKTSWTMDSSLPFFMFWMKTMMTAFVGMDYQRGLNMLKEYVEKGTVSSRLEFPGIKPFPGGAYVGIRTSCKTGDIGPMMEADFAKFKDWLKRSGATPKGKPFSIYHRWDLVKGDAEYTLGCAFEPVPSDLPAGFITGEIPACEAFQVEHTGPYHYLGNAWAAGMMYGRNKAFATNKKIHPFEVYETDPDEVSENEAVTLLHFPVK